MVTEEIIRKEFVHQTISHGLKKIYSIQEAVITSELRMSSGELSAWSRKAAFSFAGDDGDITYYIRILPYLRFLDIHYRRRQDRLAKRRRSKLALYNRVVWGVFYHETIPALQYSYSRSIRDYIRSRLEQALPVESQQLAALGKY